MPHITFISHGSAPPMTPLKTTIAEALMRHLEQETDHLRTRIDAGRDDWRMRIRYSDCMDNLKALQRMPDPESAITLLELEERRLHDSRTLSSERYPMVVAKVPHPIDGCLDVMGTVYRLSWHHPPTMAYEVGTLWLETRSQDERWIRQIRVIANA